jgi:hypothetical protein
MTRLVLFFGPLPIVWGAALLTVAAARVAGRGAPASDTATRTTVLSQASQVASLVAVFAWRQSLPLWAGAGTCRIAHGQGGATWLLGLACVATASAAAFASARQTSAVARTGSLFATVALFLITAGLLTITAFCDPS